MKTLFYKLKKYITDYIQKEKEFKQWVNSLPNDGSDYWTISDWN